MAYLGILSLETDAMNQDAFKECKNKDFGPYANYGSSTEKALFAIYAGEMGKVSYVMSSVNQQAYSGKVYGCNMNTLPTDPMTATRKSLLATLTVGSGTASAPASDKGYTEGGWRWLIFTETSTGAKASNVYVDIEAAMSR